MMLSFAALHESAPGTRPPCRDVRYNTALGGLAELSGCGVAVVIDPTETVASQPTVAAEATDVVSGKGVPAR